MVCIQINGHTFAAPLRSHIKHKHVLWTNKAAGCGVDFSKAVVIKDSSYISAVKPHIRQNEFDALRGQEYIIAKKMNQYIKEYKKAKMRLDIPRNRLLCEYSTLQYFEDCL